MSITSYELEVSDDGNSWTPLNSSLHLLRQIVQSHRSFARDEEVLPDTRAQLRRSRRVVESQERDYSERWRRWEWRQWRQSAAVVTIPAATWPGNNNRRRRWRRRWRRGSETPAQPDPPTPISATVDGNKLVLTYNELLDRGSVPAPGDFTVSTGDVESVSVSGSRVTLILETPAMPGEEVTLSYSTWGKTAPEHNRGRGHVFHEHAGREHRKSAGAGGDEFAGLIKITLTYDEPLDKASVPTTGSYHGNGGWREPGQSPRSKVNGKKVTLTLEIGLWSAG